jgi:nitronate monooxygenase
MTLFARARLRDCKPILRPVVAAGLDPDSLPERGGIEISKDIDIGARESGPARWRDIWSAGHSTSGALKVSSVADLISQTLAEYQAA